MSAPSLNALKQNWTSTGTVANFHLSRDISTTISEHPKGHPGLNSKAEEESKGNGKGIDTAKH